MTGDFSPRRAFGKLCLPKARFFSASGVLVPTMLVIASNLVGNPACATDNLMFPTPRNAEQRGHVVLQPSIAEQDHYFVVEEFPSTTVFDHYNKVFAKWISCKAPHPGWISYGDLSSRSERFIHINTKFWVSKDNKTSITVFLRYESRSADDHVRPDNNRQFVGVLRHRVDDARSLLSTFNAECPTTPNAAR